MRSTLFSKEVLSLTILSSVPSQGLGPQLVDSKSTVLPLDEDEFVLGVGIEPTHFLVQGQVPYQFGHPRIRVQRRGFEPLLPLSQRDVLTNYTRPCIVDRDGTAPSLSHCKCDVLTSITNSPGIDPENRTLTEEFWRLLCCHYTKSTYSQPDSNWRYSA